MAGSVQAQVSKKTLEFTPDSSSDSFDISVNSENEFDVTVINKSDKFASFQLELSTPGLDDNSQIKWYSVQPEICAKKPPGDQTTFHVAITKAPIPAYDTTIDLILKVLSVEYENLHTSQKLRLTINKPLRSLQVEVPNKEFKLRPGDSIEIPVLVYNLSPKFTEITVTCTGLDPEWMTAGRERKLLVEPGDSEKTSFWCQPPKDTQTLSKKYKFTIEAKSNTSQYTTREQGIVEVIPYGVVQFSCIDKQQTIPGKGRKQSSAIYELVFKNESNLPHLVNITIPEQEQKQCDFQTIPEGLNLASGETRIMNLEAKKKRPWFGLKQRLLFEVSSELTNPDSGEPSTDIFADPNTQILELKVLPVIPFLLQVGGGALILLLLLLNWLLRPHVYHTGPVNSVRFFGNGSLVFSGSSDQTIRRWQVEESLFNSTHLKDQGKIANPDQTQKAVRVIRQSPKDNDLLAVGLENGEVKLWDISTNEPKKTHLFEDKADRVFDLVFTQNGRYLFSGHGSGLIKQWNLENPNKKLQNYVNVNFAVSALAINERPNVSPLVFIAGRFNKIAAWDWSNHNRVKEIPYKWKDREKERPVFGQHQYITSLATANNILASADNQGYITLWNVNKVRQCLNKAKSCDDAILAQWRDGHHKQPVRSVALTQQACYLASAGDDGRVMLWHFDKDLADISKKGHEVASLSGETFNSVDIKALNNYVLLTTGDNNNQVRLYRVNGMKDNESCK